MQENYNLLPLTELQLEEQLDQIVYFLRSVHPSLDNADGYRPCVEIRPINRGERNFMLSRSLPLWDLSDKSIERLREFLRRHNGQPTCLFYSVFTFDNNKEATTTKQKSAKPNKITLSSALGTDEIALDFDNIDFDGYIELVDRFEDLGIYAIWVSTGHGYHAHILLNETMTDKAALKRFVFMFRAKGFDCDPACIDPARVMRLPATYNCKCFADEAYADEREDPPACELLLESAHRYDIDFIMEQLNSLPTVSLEDEKEYTSLSSQPVKAEPEQAAALESDEDVVTVRRIEYPYLQDKPLAPAVSRMLAHTPHGFRNKVLGFLIKHFRDHFRMSKAQIYEILALWSKEACDPELPEQEFEADFKRLYYKGGLKFDSSLAKKFGSIDFDQMVQLRKKVISIPFKFFEAFSELDGKAVRLYLGIKLLEHIEEEVTQEALAKLLSISDRALRPTLQDLQKANFVYLKKGNRRAGIPNTYHSQKLYSKDEGYVSFSYNDIRAYIMELFEAGSRGNGELKLYLFMRWKFDSNSYDSGIVFMSQNHLGEYIGVARNSISDMVYKLQDKHFLKIRKIKKEYYYESCEYTLLR